MLMIINKIVGLVPPMVWAGMTVVFLGMFLMNSWRLDSANKALGAANVAVDRAKEVNLNNEQVVNTLQNGMAECIAGREADEVKFAASKTGWLVEKQRLAGQAQEVRREEIEVYRDPTCADLAKLDVNDSCPDLAKQLRVRTSSLDRIRNGGSEGAGTNPGPG